MLVERTRLPEVLLLKPRVFGDERGFFMETWNKAHFDEAVGAPVEFVQDNHARSTRGVLRGLHYQIQHPQGKLVRVVSGHVFDVTVDMRRSSPRLGQWVGVELSAENQHQLWIPPGFAHGYLTLSETADFLYKATDYYEPQHERGFLWNDPHVAIDWPLSGLDGAPILSAKDLQAAAWAHSPLYD